MFCKAKIVTEGYRTRLFLNDNEVTGLVSLDLSINLDEAPTLTLEVRPMELELEIDGVVVERKAEGEEKVFMSLSKSEVVRYLMGGGETDEKPAP